MKTKATVTVQYLNQELQLFDGIQQLTKGFISQKQGKYFFYSPLGNASSIIISLKSMKDVKYRIMCQATDWARFFKTDIPANIYPRYTDK